MGEACVFCDIIAGKFGTEFLYEDDALVAFADLRPVVPSHTLVVPREHFADLPAVAAAPGGEALLGKLAAASAKIGEQQSKGAGFRIVVNTGAEAGQTVFHVHLHVLSGRHFTWPPG
ncbi:MAG TPA: HIT domain-containing protein [Candidatus Eremiobacteraceae bacterium]|nr:HIT domain-containing protein [Candidatus Eremiobacteraceae bacterium]